MCRYFTEPQYPYSSPETGIAAANAIADLLATARPAGVPVFYTTQDLTPRTLITAGRFTEKMNPIDGSFARDPRCHEIVAEVQPLPADTVIVKPKPSAFFGTQLAGMLTFLGIDTLIVTGVTTSGCIRSTVDHAFALNYRVIVPVECVADRVTLPHEINLYDMDTTSADVVSLESVKKELASRTVGIRSS
jgi:nicotinamidase-related amidase